MLLATNTFLKNYKFKSVACVRQMVTVVTMASLILSIMKPSFAQAQGASEHEKFLGSWIETRESGSSENRGVFKIMQEEDGSLKGYMNSPDLGLFDEIPISKVSIRGDSLIFNIEKLETGFKGKMNASNSHIKGKWLPSGEEPVQFTLVRLTPERKESLPEPPEAKRPKAKPEDVKSPEAIVNASLNSISGQAGEKREWDRKRSLFLPGAQISSTSRVGGAAGKQTWTVNEYIKEVGKRIEKENFYEKQIHSIKERFGDIAHVFSTYQTSRTPDGKPFMRGVNSYQLWYDGDRWWIYSLIWHSEWEDTQIPQKYLGE